MKISPHDLNPALLEKPVIDPDTLARLRAPRIDPAGPLLNLQPPPGWLLLDMPNEFGPEEVGGIHVGQNRQQQSAYAVATVLKAGAGTQYAEGDKVLVNRRSSVDHAGYDGRSYWRVVADSVFAKVLA